MRVWFLTILMACGGGEDPVDTAAPATSAQSTSTPGTTSSTADPTTWDCNEWYPCQECGGERCINEISACANDSGCGAALNAWAGCVLDCGYPGACADTFEQDGGALAADLVSCSTAECGDTCDLP